MQSRVSPSAAAYSLVSFMHPTTSVRPRVANRRILVLPRVSPQKMVAEERGSAEEKRQKLIWPALDEDGVTERQKLAISELSPKLTRRCMALLKRIICQPESLPMLLDSWVKIMKPSRSDWLVVLKEMQRMENPLLLEVMKYALAQESFEVNIRDYTKIIDTYAKHNRPQDAESAFAEMKTRGFTYDQVTLTVLVNMYGKSGNLERAKEIFEEIRLLCPLVDKRAYGAMIMAYVRAGRPELGEDLLSEMENNQTYACREVYKALLRSYSINGNADGAQRIFNMIQLAAIVPDAKICALLVNAYCVAGRSDDARSILENMRKAGLQPNDKCVALMLEAYEKENKLEEAMSLLIELERDHIAIEGEAAKVLALWLSRLGVADETVLTDELKLKIS